ncbi:hypothetical protein EOL96_09005, partial [Candidatus Saccharibacteria bacterium]|nr:hypothetical protein [Candidatus Saccharibacteria bacterium]
MRRRVNGVYQQSLVFLKAKWKWLIALLVIVLLLEAFIQLLYPSNQTLPFAKLGGQAVGGQTKNELAATLQQQLAEYQVVFVAGDNSETIPLNDIGATVDADVFIEQAHSYPILYRILPFSIFWYDTIPSEYLVLFKNGVLEEKGGAVSKKLTSPPKDASIELDENGEITVTPAKDGYVIDAADIMAAAQGATYDTATKEQRIVVDAPTEAPSITNTDVAAVKVLAEDVLDQSIKISIEDKTVEPKRADIADWIAFKESDDGTISLIADAKAITAYVNELNT